MTSHAAKASCFWPHGIVVKSKAIFALQVSKSLKETHYPIVIDASFTYILYILLMTYFYKTVSHGRYVMFADFYKTKA